MALARNKMPLSSFDPRYLELILRGAREVVELRQTTRKDAKRLRQILTTFRARYADHHRENPSTWEPLYGAIIGVSDDGFSTVIRPRALEAEHLLSNIVTSPATPSASPSVFTAPHLDDDPLAEFDEE